MLANWSVSRISRTIVITGLLLVAPISAVRAQNQSAPDKSTADPAAQDADNKDKGTGVGEGTKGDPIEISTGAFCYSKDLFDIPGRDLNLKLRLGYVSNAQGIETQTGARWTHSYEEKLVVTYTFAEAPKPYDGPQDVLEWFSSHSITPDAGLHAIHIDLYHFHDLRIDHYTRDSADQDNWLPEDGQFTKLKSTSHYSGPYLIPDDFTLRYPDGHKTVFPHTNLEQNCGVFTFRASQQIDRNGNTIDFTYSTASKATTCPASSATYKHIVSAADPFGNHIDFAYDSAGWLDTITAVTGTLSRVVTLTHDTVGNMTSITTPAVSVLPPDTTSLGYSAATTDIEYVTYTSTYPHSAHNIARIIAPTEVDYAAAHSTTPVPYVENTWNTICEQVLSQTVGGTNASGIPAGGTYAFLYDTVGATYANFYSGALTGFSPLFAAKHRTLSVDPDGHVQLHVFDTNYRECLVYTFTGAISPASIAGGSISSIVSITPSSPSTSDHLSSPTEAALGSTSATCMYVLSAYNSDNLVTAEYAPDSRRTFVYDSANGDRFQKGNLLITKEVSNASISDTIQHAYVYEPLYNQVRVAYDPRAFGTYTPPNGGTYTPERYSVQTTFDYQLGSSSGISTMATYWGIDLAQSTAISALSGLSVSSIGFGSGSSATAGNPVSSSRTVRVYNNALATPPTFTTLTETTTVAYNSTGLPTLITDAAGFKQRFTYYSASASAPSIGSSSSASNAGYLATASAAIDLAETETVMTQYGYDAMGHVNAVRNPRGFDTTSEHDEMDRLVKTTDALGTARGTLYDENCNALEEITAYSQPTMDSSTGMPTGSSSTTRYIRTTMEYDILDHLVQRQVQNGPSPATPSVVKYRYTRGGSSVLTLHPEWGSENKNVEASVFDEFKRPWTNTHGGVTTQFAGISANADIPELSSIPVAVTGVTATTRSEYNLSRLITWEDAEGHQTQYAYDGFNRPIQRTDPVGNYTTSDLDKAGNTVQTSSYDSSSVLLAQVSFASDERDQVFQQEAVHNDQTGAAVGDGAATTRHVFDIRGQESLTDDDAGDCWSMDFDGLGRMISKQDPAQDVLTYGYDSNSNLIYTESTEPESDVPTTTHTQRAWKFHDELDRVRVEVNELGYATRYLYDTEGRVICKTDPRSSSITVSLASLDSTTHPQHGSLSSGPTVNTDGNTTWYAYDDAGYLLETKLHQRASGLGNSALLSGGAKEIVNSRSYDLNGLLRTQMDDSGNVTSYHYDALNRLDSTTYANSTSDSRTYYLNGLVASETDANGTTVAYSYYANDLISAKTITLGTNVYGPTLLSYDYDGLGRLTEADTPTWAVSRAYDTLSQLVEETANGRTTEIGRDSLGRLSGYQYPGGRQLQVGEDSIGRLRWVKNTGGSTISTLEYRDAMSIKGRTLVNGTTSSYQYDALRRTTDTAHLNGSTYIDHRQYAWDRQSNKTSRSDLLRSRTLSYEYDSVAKMNKSIRTDTGTQTISYRMDDVGNRRQVTGGSDGGTYTLGTTDIPVNLYTSTPFDSRTYDSNQNLSSISSTVTLYYDYANRMVQYYDSAAGVQHLYEYDALGRRVTKVVDNGGPHEATTQYYYDGGARVVEEQDASGATLATYVYEQGIDEIVSMRRGSTDYYYHADDLGNVTEVTNGSGAVAEAYDYKDYGQVVDPSSYSALTSSSIGNTHLFNGRELDWETGLYYYRTRYMDPRSGRFISRDSIGTWGDAGNYGNGMAYCGSNPWSRLDPLGLAWSALKGSTGGSRSNGGDSDHPIAGNTRGSVKGDLRNSGPNAPRNNKGKLCNGLSGDTQHKGNAYNQDGTPRNGGNGPKSPPRKASQSNSNSNSHKTGERIPSSCYEDNDDGDDVPYCEVLICDPDPVVEPTPPASPPQGVVFTLSKSGALKGRVVYSPKDDRGSKLARLVSQGIDPDSVGETEIYIKYKTAGLVANHAWVVARNPLTGHCKYTRAGPNARTVGSSGDGATRAPFGDLHAVGGDWNADSFPDPPSEVESSRLIGVLPMSLTTVGLHMAEFEQAVNNAHEVYFFQNMNSNTYAAAFLQTLNLDTTITNGSPSCPAWCDWPELLTSTGH